MPRFEGINGNGCDFVTDLVSSDSGAETSALMKHVDRVKGNRKALTRKTTIRG